jgi:hypothetical protein
VYIFTHDLIVSLSKRANPRVTTQSGEIIMNAPMTATRRNTLVGAATFTATSALGSRLPLTLGPSSAIALPASKAIDTRIGKLEFTHEFPGSYPTKDTVQRLYDERDFQRAVQGYLWAIPMVSTAGLKRVVAEAGASDGVFMPLTKYASLSHFLTPNTTTPYILTVFNLGETGPFVFEVPSGPTAGFVDDLWQRPVTDIGQPGPDKGNGAKFLVFGPGQSAPTDMQGYIPVQSTTNNNFMIIRMLSADAAENQTMQSKLRAYRYSQRDNPPAAKMVEPIPYPTSTTMGSPPRGIAYFEVLAELVQQEPVQERGRIMMGMLRSIGIEKGKSFDPDERMKRILEEAAFIGEAMAMANDFDKRGMPSAHYDNNSTWDVALLLNPSQETENYTQVDERAAWFYEATATSAGMTTKTPGIGSVYLSAYKDKDGDWLDGANTYRLRVPPNPPVAQFWSLTAYDVNTRSLLQNKGQISDRSSRMDLVKNSDGSVDVFVGPSAPKGYGKNWVPSIPNQGWFAYFRLYGPTEAYFNRTWVLADFEKVS